ncbi:hypothetical protein DRQ36_10725 [bacterium]|nr:MAG: hypothetical protein DRQ36_10725 [bacterium]
MNPKNLNKLINDETWQRFRERLQTDEAAQVLERLVQYIIESLAARIDDIQVFEDKALMFFAGGKEIIRINIGRKELRVYIHPAAGALFEPEVDFDVGKFNLWDSSFRKTSGKYCGMSFWVSEMKDLPGVKKIIGHIPAK